MANVTKKLGSRAGRRVLNRRHHAAFRSVTSTKGRINFEYRVKRLEQCIMALQDTDATENYGDADALYTEAMDHLESLQRMYNNVTERRGN